MALFQLKISLPDQPGSLGAKDGIGYDDFLVAVPGTDPTDLVTVLSSMGGVTVISIEAVTQ